MLLFTGAHLPSVPLLRIAERIQHSPSMLDSEEKNVYGYTFIQFTEARLQVSGFIFRLQ
jgi:hypothetical protein